jgi:hypothetical protein
MNAQPSALARFRRRSPTERKLLARTTILFVAAHLLSRQRDLRRTRDRMAALARRVVVTAASPAELSWAVASVNHALPGHHSCLINALCCEAIAMNSGIATDFRIGAAQQQGRMHFHAWVEHEGVALTGAHDGEFAPLS